MPWYVTVLGIAGPLVWALYLLWRVEREKRRGQEQKLVIEKLHTIVDAQELAIANAKRDADNHESVLSYLKGQLIECEGALDAQVVKSPGSLRESWRDRLRAMQAPTGKPDSD